MSYEKPQDTYLTVRIAEDVKQKLREMAERDGRSLSNHVKHLLTKATQHV